MSKVEETGKVSSGTRWVCNHIHHEGTPEAYSKKRIICSGEDYEKGNVVVSVCDFCKALIVKLNGIKIFDE